MNDTDFLDAFGEADDEAAMKTQAGNGKRRLVLIGVACVLLILVISALVLFRIPAARTVEPTMPLQSDIQDGLVELFCVGDAFYYTNQQGQLYLQTENGSQFVKAFPTGNLFWTEAGEAFLYYHMGAIVSWNPAADTTTTVADGLPQPEEGRSGCFLAQIGEDCFFWVFNTTYRYHLPTGELFTEETEAAHPIACNDRYYLYVRDQNIICIDAQTGQRKELLTLEPLQTITCACIDGDTLFYVSDFRLHSAALAEGADDGTGRILPLRDYKYIQAIAFSGEDMVFVTESAALSEDGDHSGRLTKIMLCTREGEIITLRQPAQPEFVTPGSCKLAATENRYCFGVRSDPMVVVGDISIRRDE